MSFGGRALAGAARKKRSLDLWEGRGGNKWRGKSRGDEGGRKGGRDGREREKRKIKLCIHRSFQKSAITHLCTNPAERTIE